MATIHKPKKVAVDLDGTTFNTHQAYANGFRSMMHALVENVGGTKEEVTAEVAAHIQEYGFEDAYLLHTLKKNGYFERMDFDLNRHGKSLKQDVRSAFNASMTKHLRIFNGMGELLASARKQDIEVIGLTDATKHGTLSKINRRFLDLKRDQFNRIFALRTNERPDVEEFEADIERLDGKRRHEFTEIEEAKPDSDFPYILGMSEDEMIGNVAVLGDNYMKDMGLVQRYEGIQGYHALWGVQNYLEHRSKLDPFTEADLKLTPKMIFPPSYPVNITPVGHPSALYELWDIKNPADFTF
jgi:FMN phosphatase YigB (HAD superfamily)